MIINHNITALNTHRQLGNATNAQANSMEKLSSGLRINSAKDDAAGLSISEKMRGQIRGLEQASSNAQDGISLMQTAEGALNETHDILQRMRELAVQAGNDTNTGTDRGELQKEVNQLAEEITRISENTEFNTMNLLGKDGKGFEGKFQIGANKDQNISIQINDMGASALKVGETYTAGTNTLLDADGATVGTFYAKDAEVVAEVTTEGSAADAINASQAGYYKNDGTLVLAAKEAFTADAKVSAGIDISSQETANTAIEVINTAIESVSSERSKLGATQNRLEHTINNLNTSAENLTSAESRIRDVDYAEAA